MIIMTDWGYLLVNISVTMKGTDVTASVVTDNVINIPYVMGEIVITATTHYTTINIVDFVGYQNDTRLSQATGDLKEQDGYTATADYIALEPAAMYRIAGLDFTASSDYCMLSLYDDNYSTWTAVTFGPDREYPFNYPSDRTPVLNIDCDKNGVLIVIVAEDLLTNHSMDQGRFFRICGYGAGENLFITKNQDLPDIETLMGE